ncbi:MAG TPA: hypothetical protein VFP68_21040, partial [Burkholderiaceae bacterium]|nr:hypothetical protein [Burkholderiaceae bacterium]
GAAQDRFWPALSRALLERSIDLGPADIVNKVVTADALAIEGVGARIADVHPTVTRVWLERPTLRDDLHCGAGLFHETRIGGLDELPPLLPRKVQTVAHHGFAPSDLKQFLLRTRPAGIDRLVPVGSALDFEPRWDGIDLFEAFVRRVTVR